MELLLLGLMWGLISAVSLPIGAVIGLTAHIGSKFNSALMAFGGGALLFALSIELFGHALHKASHHGHIEDRLLIIIVVSTAAVGGLLFQGLNHLLNSKGAFMRRGSLLRKYVRKQKTKQARSMLKTLSKIKLLQPLPPEEVVGLMTYLTKGDYANGHVLFKEGESGDRLYFIVSGKVRLTRNIDGTEQEVAVLGMEMCLEKSPLSATRTERQLPLRKEKCTRSSYFVPMQSVCSTCRRILKLPFQILRASAFRSLPAN